MPIDRRQIEYGLHAPDLASYQAALTAIVLPDGQPLARLPDEGETAGDTNALIYHPLVRGSEIGIVVRTPGEYDDEGEEIAPPVIVPGYHANLMAVGDMVDALTAGMPTEGDVFARSRILELLGLEMTWTAVSVDGVPAGYVGPHGVRIFDLAVINNRARVTG